MTATVTNKKGLFSIARENKVSLGDLYKANPGLKDMKDKGTIPSGYKVKIPNKNKVSTPKPKPKSASKKTVKKSNKKQPKTQVCRNSKGKIVACKKCVPPSWMKFAQQEQKKRIKEWNPKGIMGKNAPKSNPEIMKYHKVANKKGVFVASNDGQRNAWCGSFMAWVAKKAGYRPPSLAFRANSWKKFGKGCNKAIRGAIALQGVGHKHHTAIVLGVTPDGEEIGGNQDDSLSVKRYPLKTKKGSKDWSFRIPSDYD